MSDYASMMAAAKISEVGSRVNGRLQQISSATGLSFPTLFASVVSALEKTGGEADTDEIVEAVDKTLDTLVADETQPEPAVGADRAVYGNKPYADLIERLSEKYGIDPALVHAVVTCESSYNPNCLSSAGAMGLMQLMPDEVETFGVTDPYDPEQNLDAGIRCIIGYIQRYDGDVKMGLAAYNCGSYGLSKRGVTDLNDESQYALLPTETRNYINRIGACLANMGRQDLFDQPYYI